MIKLRKISKVLAILLIFALSINTFSAIVSDNDGSAFVTKNEFNTMRNNFEDQIDNYNDSLDGKIDGAIAAYLAGLVTTITQPRDIIYKDAVKYGVISISTSSVLEYQFGIPMCKYEHQEGRFVTNSNSQVSATLYKSSVRPSRANKYRQEKTVITDLYANNSNTDLSIAKWDGYYDYCYDEIDFGDLAVITEWAGSRFMSFAGNDYMIIQDSRPLTNFDLTKIDLINGNSCFETRWGTINGSTSVTGVNASGVVSFRIANIVQDWGKVRYPYVSVLNNYKYDMFSNKERNFNWSYPGTYKEVFKDKDGRSFANGTDKRKGNGYSLNGWLQETNIAYHFSNLFYNQAIPCYHDSFNQTVSPYKIENQAEGSARINANNVRNGTSNTVNLYMPTLGFETTYLKKWSQVYYDSSTSIGKKYKEMGFDASNSVLTNDKDPKRITYHLGLTSGFPLIQTDKNSAVKYNLRFKDTTKDYIVWVSDKPFIADGHPDRDPNCLKLKGLEKSDVGERGYIVKKGNGTFTTDALKDESVIFVKWGIYNKDLYKVGGGILMPEQKGFIIK